MVQLIRARMERRHEEGVLAVIVAFSAVMIFVLAALVVDLGLARDTDRQAQNSADAAVLAAGNALYDAGKTPHFDLAIQAAEEYAESNFGVTEADWAGCIDEDALDHQVEGETPCISFNSATAPTEVRVVIPERRVETPLAGVAGQSDVEVSGAAQMKLQPNTRATCGLCILGNGDIQNGNVLVADTNVHFNGNVTMSGGGQVKATDDGLVAPTGAITVTGTTSGGSFSPPAQYADPVLDPLSHVKLPLDWASVPVGPTSGPCGTAGPGRYGAFSLNATTTCNLLPGLYVITGTWSFSGQASLVGTGGVTLYFTCGTPGVPHECTAGETTRGTIDQTGQGDVKITAPSSGATQGLAIVYDRLNAATIRLTGNGASQIIGTVYAKSATLDPRGNGCSTGNDALVVIGNVSFSGNNACFKSTYSEDLNVPMPPTDLHLSR